VIRQGVVPHLGARETSQGTTDKSISAGFKKSW
jgi:hypothetical protein